MIHGTHFPSAEIGDTYGFMLGEWQIDRALRDRRLHETGGLSGTVTIAPLGSDHQHLAQYTEVGELHFGQYRGTAHRRLRYVRQEDGAVSVTFQNGRRFVTCDLRSGLCRSAHLCRDDRYEITWRVCARDLMIEEWRVRGPHKDYDASSVLRRVRAPRS